MLQTSHIREAKHLCGTDGSRCPHQNTGLKYLADDVLDEFVHSEGSVGVDSKHFPQRVLVLSWLHVSIQKIAHHLQKDGVIVLHINIHCRKVRKRKTFKEEAHLGETVTNYYLW